MILTPEQLDQILSWYGCVKSEDLNDREDDELYEELYKLGERRGHQTEGQIQDVIDNVRYVAKQLSGPNDTIARERMLAVVEVLKKAKQMAKSADLALLRVEEIV